MTLWLAGAALAPVAAVAQTPPPPAAPAAAPARPQDPLPLTVEGQPVDNRPTQKPGDKPLFPEQTRAPYHKSVPFNVTTVTTKLTRPWSLAFLSDGKMLVTERPGVLRTVDPSGAVSEPIAGVPAVKSKGGLGLLDVELDPNFAKTRRLYLSFDEAQEGDTDGIAVARATLSPDDKSLSDVTVIFRTVPALTAKQGNPDKGGRMAVGKDGYLYVGLGGRSLPHPNSWPQDLDKDLGKIVRLTPDGKPAPGNPFIGKGGVRPEIWSSGHRNPSGMAFDAQGRLWETEHGPHGGDELNLIQPGKNYGWPVIAHGLDDDDTPLGDGQTAKAGMEQPRYYWDPVIAPSSLAFYNANLFPAWKGSAFVGALRGQQLDRLTVKGDRIVGEEPLLTDLRTRVREVRVGPEGAVYVVTDGGSLLKLTPK